MAHGIIDRVREEVRRYMASHPGFVPVGEGMLAAWRAGVDGWIRSGTEITPFPSIHNNENRIGSTVSRYVYSIRKVMSER